ncbi:transmembrane protein 220 [Eurytemora carolleeae]|uniref:transmembrane protein 220 n=1 Tax=Eurytemora carolleeae TaxID=1294199 RepID=UPI000C76BF2F|nr:transmembrane protein 220 [Eurytemora carolleeae]|eukprot:XP_023342064.1 transmembrane protein 220-like [Eurytemora affinis]
MTNGKSVLTSSSIRRSARISARRKVRIMEALEDGSEESTSTTYPPTYSPCEFFLFRAINAIMVIFFLIAISLLKDDDNACLWVPTFLVPAFLSTIVAIKPQLSACTWWKGWIIIHTSLSIILALLWFIQLIRTYHSEKENTFIQQTDGGSDFQFNPLDYEEGKETLGILIIIAWMKTTSYVSKSQFRNASLLPAPKRLVATAIYMSVIPLFLTGLCLLRCTSRSNSCLAIIGL